MRQRRSSAAVEAQEAIKQYLLEQRLVPGDPLPSESALCEQFGVSRSSVREAIRTLTALDIVDVQHGTGTFVGNLSLEPLVNGLAFRGVLIPGERYQTLREVIEIRTMLDLGIAEVIVCAVPKADNADLHLLCDQMTAFADRGADFAEQDCAFHVGLLARLPNRLLGQLVEALWKVHADVVPRLGLPTPDDRMQTARAHGGILRAAERGDLESYRTAVIEHYRPLIRVLDIAAAKSDVGEDQSEGRGQASRS